MYYLVFDTHEQFGPGANRPSGVRNLLLAFRYIYIGHKGDEALPDKLGC